MVWKGLLQKDSIKTNFRGLHESGLDSGLVLSTDRMNALKIKYLLVSCYWLCFFSCVRPSSGWFCPHALCLHAQQPAVPSAPVTISFLSLNSLFPSCCILTAFQKNKNKQVSCRVHNPGFLHGSLRNVTTLPAPFLDCETSVSACGSAEAAVEQLFPSYLSNKL